MQIVNGGRLFCAAFHPGWEFGLSADARHRSTLAMVIDTLASALVTKVRRPECRGTAFKS